MDLNIELKGVIDELGTAVKQLRADVEAQTKNGDALLAARIDKLNDTITDLELKKGELERKITAEGEYREELERKFNLERMGAGATDEVEQKAVSQFNLAIKALARERGQNAPADISTESFRAYKSAWFGMVRKGRENLTSEEVKAMQVGVDADGGYLVPPDTTGRITKKVYEQFPLRARFSNQTIGTDALEGIEDLGEASAGWVAEIGTRSDSNTPQIGKWRIPVHEMYSQPKATQKLLDDAAVDVEGWLAAKVADKFARVQAAAFITGTGTGQPRGLCMYPTAATADSTRAWGTFEHLATGVNGDFAASSPADILFDAILATKSAYLANAAWLTRRTVIAKIRKLKEATTNAYMWQPGLQQGQPSQLLGYPVEISEDMPALATGSLSLAFGDLAATYTVVDRVGLRTLRDPFTDKPYVKFYTTARVGGGALNFESLKFVKFGS